MFHTLSADMFAQNSQALKAHLFKWSSYISISHSFTFSPFSLSSKRVYKYNKFTRVCVCPHILKGNSWWYWKKRSTEALNLHLSNHVFMLHFSENCSILSALLMCYTCVKNSYGATNTCSYCLCHHQHHTPKTKPTATLTVPQAERGPGRATRCGQPARGGGLRCTAPQSSECTPYPARCTSHREVFC